jgi:hypothetical protein
MATNERRPDGRAARAAWLAVSIVAPSTPAAQRRRALVAAAMAGLIALAVRR